MKPEKRIEKSRETIDIYAPLASRLGIYTIKFELEDTALKYLKPEVYETLKIEVTEKREQRLQFINEVIEEIREALDDMGIEFDIKGRSKHLYSVYKKMVLQHKQLDEIFDLTAIRVIVDTVRDCYAVLGQVHTMWKPLPGRFKDYIAMPKPNMYQSLHTTVLGDNGEPFEIQIRTKDMHRVAEYGIAAHWKYKEGNANGDQNNEDLKLAWVRQTLEWQKELNDPKEFMETLKMDLFASQVFVFTPKGEVLDLPAGSTPLDFAFKIHTAVGCKCVGAKVNGKMVTIDHTLNNGDIVEIVTSSNSSGPSIDWLKIAKSSTARTKIRQWLKKENKSDDVTRGKDLLDKTVRKKGYDPQQICKESYLRKSLKDLNINSTEELYTQISKGGTLLSKVINTLVGYMTDDKNLEEKRAKEKEEALLKLRENKKTKQMKKNSENPGIIVKGADNLMIRVSRCCNPVPGDEIIGFITKGRGISVHRVDCSNITSLPESEKARFIEVEWEDLDAGKSYNADVCILCSDRKGMLSDISKVCDDHDVKIMGINAKTTDDDDNTLKINLTIAIGSTQQMQRILRAFRNIESVYNVYRARG